jgi:Single-strand binding protein family
MTERRLAGTPAPPAADAPVWDIPGVAAALGAPPEARTDVVLGRGVVFRLGVAPAVDLELYEQARTVRMTGGDVQIALFNQDGPTVASEGVVFELHGAPRRRFFSVAASGKVSLLLAPPPRTPQEALNPAERPIPLPSPTGPPGDDSVTSEGASRTPFPDAETTERGRVRLAGRLGTDPRFRETRTGVLIGSFPLGIKQDDGSTAWEQVVAFRERAERLRGETGPKKGQFVEVIGYRHRRVQPNREGTKTKMIEEVYAVVVKPR